MIQTKSYTFDNLHKLKDRSIALHSHLFEIPHHKNEFIRRNDKLSIFFFFFFTADIVGAAHDTEDPHNICVSEPLAPIMTFPTRGTGGMHPCVTNTSFCSAHT